MGDVDAIEIAVAIERGALEKGGDRHAGMLLARPGREIGRLVAVGPHGRVTSYERREDFAEIAVINPAHAKALHGHKTGAKDARLAELFECGLLHGSCIPAPELKEVRDLTRYRMKTVQARTSEIH